MVDEFMDFIVPDMVGPAVPARIVLPTGERVNGILEAWDDDEDVSILWTPVRTTGPIATFMDMT